MNKKKILLYIMKFRYSFYKNASGFTCVFFVFLGFFGGLGYTRGNLSFDSISMLLSQCESQLQDTYETNPVLADNLSKITNSAWKLDKASCLQQMGGVSGVKNFLFKKSQYIADQAKNSQSGNQQTTQAQQQVQQTTTQSDSSSFDGILQAVQTW